MLFELAGNEIEGIVKMLLLEKRWKILFCETVEKTG
jgi:hypothetical protein